MKSNRLIWDQVKDKDKDLMEKLKHVETSQSENEKTKNMVLTMKMVFDSSQDHFTVEGNELIVSLEYESED